MKKLFILLFFALSACSTFSSQKERPKIGLCIVATGNYCAMAEKLITSARQFFCPDCAVTYFVFTDGPIVPAVDLVRVEQPRLGWPYDTLKRFHIYEEHQELLKEMDYLFAIDADMLFVGQFGREILGERVAVQHPGYLGKRGTFERRKHSTAYVEKKVTKRKRYMAGGFYGGSKEEFLKLVQSARKAVDCDIANEVIALWHDESHLNRYFIDHPPTTVLSPAYCFPENYDLPYEKKLLALSKKHEEVRK